MSPVRPSFDSRLVCATLCVLVVATGATAATLPDKSGYTLLNPAPDSVLRELSTDRPDATESPFTVDAGHVQLEMNLAGFTGNRRDGTRTREWSVAPFNLRLGLSNHFEAGVFIAPYTRHTEEPRGGPRETHRGFGDVTVRSKVNFRGNDEGGPGFGLIVDLKLPTAAEGLGNESLEGDVILPMAFDLPAGWELGAMTKGELRHRDGGGTRGVWINTATLGHDLTRDVSGYVELTSEAGDGSHVATCNVGCTLKLNPNAQLDLGANLGISQAADDVEFFAGLSRRF